MEKNKHLTMEDRAKNFQWLVVGQRGTKRLIKEVNRFPPQDSGRQKLQKRKADRNSPDSRKRGKQALIEKVRAERRQELARTGVTLLPSTPLLPRTGEVADAEGEEVEWEDTEEGTEENLDNKEQRRMNPAAL